MKTITVSGGSGMAKIDDEDFDRLTEHNWFFDQTQIYSKMVFPSGKSKPFSKTFKLKVRLDYFLFNYSPHINAKIVHKNGDPYDCQRDNLEVKIKDEGSPHYPRTIYSGVIVTSGKFKNESKEPYLLVEEEKYRNGIMILDGGYDPTHLAHQYDILTRRHRGNDARANFLLEPLLRKNSVAGDGEATR